MKTIRVNINSCPPWLTKEIEKEMKKRKLLKKQKKFDEYKKQRNYVKNLIRKSKKQYFNSLVQDQKDIRNLWKALNTITKGQNSKFNNIPKKFTSQIFNDHFISMIDSLVKNHFNENNDYEISNELNSFCSKKLKNMQDKFMIPFLTVNEVTSLVLQMKNTKSCGLDKISTNILKLSIPFLAEPLTYMYNKCIEKKCFS